MRAFMEGRLEKMREVKVKRVDLLNKVQANRYRHIKAYEAAIVGYQKAAIKKLNAATRELARRTKALQSGKVIALELVSFKLDMPKSHQKDYDQVIAMLNMSVDKEHTVRSDEFAMYVMDDWEWKEDFVNSVSLYNKRRS